MSPLLRPLPAWLRGSIASVVVVASTVVHVTPLLLVALIKAILPVRAVRRACDAVLMRIAESWIAVNSGMIDRVTHTRVQVEGVEALDPAGHYLVLANHQSWVDIPVLQKVFNRRIPLLRFFLKSQLIWVPFLGLAWWALDFPFMKRYSRETLEKHPELAGRDIETTRRACERFRDIPVSVMNFVEGTRFTAAKHAAQESPFRHLLRPKAGGVAFVLDAMGSALHSILDVTVCYPGGKPDVLDLFADRIAEVTVHVRRRPIPTDLAGGDYQKDAEFRARFQAWINTLWSEKDAQLDRLLRERAE